MKTILTYLMTALVLVFVTSCSESKIAGGGDATTENETTVHKAGQSGVVDKDSEKNILHIALGSDDHSTLVAAVKAADLADALTNVGPLTVFAPTNAAFAKLPKGTVEDLLKPENKKNLVNIVTYHAAPGKYGPENIRGVMGIGQATGDRVEVKTDENGVTTVNGAKVIASVQASNGWVHVIDQVLLPPQK